MMYEKRVTIWFKCVDCDEQNRSYGIVQVEDKHAFEQDTIDGLLTTHCVNCGHINMRIINQSELEQLEQSGE